MIRMMKRTLCTLLVGISFLLGACTQEDTATYEMQQDGIDMTVKNYYVDDTITKQHIETTMSYKTLGYASKEAAREANLDAEQEYNHEAGIRYKANYKRNAIATNLTIDYDKIEHLEALENLQGVTFEVESTNPVQVNKIKTEMLLKENGFKKLEE